MRRPIPTTVVLAVAFLVASAARAAELRSGPLQGHTTDRSARVWVQGTGPGEVRLRLRSGDGTTRTVGPVAFDPERAFIAVLTVDGLQPNGRWRYDLLVGEEVVEGGPWTLRTLPSPGSGAVRIAFGSCLKPSVSPEQPVFEAIVAAKPDAFLWLGDNLYFSNRDLREAKGLWKRYRKVRALPSLRALFAGCANLAQWDDHDYGPNNSDRTFPLRRVSREAFVAYWPNPSAGEDGEGIYTRAVLGPVEVFLLDDRWFRDPNRKPDGPEKVILGERQLRWLLEGLRESVAPIKVVATASQFLARYHRFESFAMASHERERLVAGLTEAGVRGVLFVSGDRHLAEVIRWPARPGGQPLWEITSSPLANRSWPDGERVPNPDRVFIYGRGPNFGWIEADAASKSLLVELRDARGKTLWSRDLSELWPGDR